MIRGLRIAGLLGTIGTLAAIMIPEFVRSSYSSHFEEPVTGLKRIGAAAVTLYRKTGALPDSVPETPGPPPRGMLRLDPKDSWEHPTWKALEFRPAPEGMPHSFSFAFERTAKGFVARARGDLDGDGKASVFELRGIISEDGTLTIDPDVIVQNEFE
jgi:hypothetical protein